MKKFLTGSSTNPLKPALVIVGLGNTGSQYENTRHNLGFIAVDVLSEHFGEGEWKENPKFKCIAQEARMLTFPILLVKPTTFMNRSGECIRKIVDFYKLDPTQQVLVLNDDIDIPLGELRLRLKGGPGTHNGLKSIVDQFGEEFPRLKLGLGPQPSGKDLSGWVLSKLTKAEKDTVLESFAKIPAMVEEFAFNETKTPSA